MDKYKKFVTDLASNNINRIFLNSDEEHALAVLVQLFQKAKHEVRIFAGSLCHHVGNKQDYIVALSEFLERGGSLHILLNRYDEISAKTSNLYKRLAYYKAKNMPIVIKTTTARPYLTEDPDKKEVHFTIGDDSAYRLETDIEQRTAECNFSNPVIAKQIASFFDGIFDQPDSTEIDLVKLFNDDNK